MPLLRAGLMTVGAIVTIAVTASVIVATALAVAVARDHWRARHRFDGLTLDSPPEDLWMPVPRKARR